MPKRKPPDPKVDALRQQGTLHPNPDRVRHPLFRAGEFFDPRDLLQVKYEMVRRVRVDGEPIGDSAAVFGLSRPSFYQAQAAVERGGLAALLPAKRGPRGAHKLGADVVDFVERARSEDPQPGSAELARRIHEQLGIKVHPRSVERALARREKKVR